MPRITDFVLRHTRLVATFWLLITLLGFASVGSATGALSQTFDISGREGFDTNQQIMRAYGNGGARAPAPVVLIAEAPGNKSLTSAAAQRELRQALAHAQRAEPGSRVVSYATTKDRAFLSQDSRTTFAYVFPPVPQGHNAGPAEPIEKIRAAVSGSTVAGAPVQVTGLEALRASEGEQSVSLLAEVLVGGIGALVVLVLVFGSPLALLPLLMAVVAIPTIFLLIWPLAEVVDVAFVVQFLVGLIGLGVAIDYALLIVTRWREERVAGADNERAVRTAMATAGQAVVFSGVAVAIGLAALLVVPVPFLRSIGIGGLFIPLVSVLVAITLLPVLLAHAGPRLDGIGYRRALRRIEAGKVSRWERWGEFTVRRRGLVGAIGIGIVIALLIPALSLQPGEPKAESLATSGPALAGFETLRAAGIGPGALTPIELLVDGGDALAEQVRAKTDGVEGVRGAVLPDGQAWQRGDLRIVEVIPVPDGSTPAAAEVLDATRAAVAGAELSDAVRVGGQTAQIADAVDAIYSSFPLLVAVLALVTFLVLARTFRSLLLPAKAVILNVLSVGAVWGFIVLAWQDGGISDWLFGIQATGAVTFWVPFLVFTFLYGLSMDYEVFILSRIREEFDRTGSTDTAVVRGLVGTGRLVTSASLILFLAFTSLAATPQTEVKILATSLAVGIVLDATVVRALILPSMVSLFGRYNWWLPGHAARMLRTRPSPARPEPPRPTKRPLAEGR